MQLTLVGYEADNHHGMMLLHASSFISHSTEESVLWNVHNHEQQIHHGYKRTTPWYSHSRLGLSLQSKPAPNLALYQTQSGAVGRDREAQPPRETQRQANELLHITTA